MNRRKRITLLLVVLLGVFLVLNTQFIWKWMYPIKFEAEVMQASQQYQVDPHLVFAIIRTESDFATDKVSKKGAIGLMQIMPDTANWVISQGEFQIGTTAQLEQPQVNIRIGTWYLSYLLEKYEGDQVKAIAAYNAGPGEVSSWLEQKKWDGTAKRIEDIPFGETRHYVQRVLYFQERYQKIYARK